MKYKMEKKRLSNQFIKFALVGVVNTLINLVVLYVLTEFFGVYYIISAIFAFIVAVTNSFVMNKCWTFNEKINHKTKTRYVKFFIVSLIALLVNLVLLYSFTELWKIHYMLSQIIAVFFSLWVNFIGNKIWTFRD